MLPRRVRGRRLFEIEGGAEGCSCCLGDCCAADDEYSEGMIQRAGGTALEDLSFLVGRLAKSPTLLVVSRVAL